MTLLLLAGADINAEGSEDAHYDYAKHSPLFTAIEFKQVHAARFLIDQGADLKGEYTYRIVHKATPLKFAEEIGDKRIIAAITAALKK